MRRDAVPFPVRSPLGVDGNTPQIERPLPPGDELLELFGQRFGIFDRFAGDQDAVFDMPAGFNRR